MYACIYLNAGLDLIQTRCYYEGDDSSSTSAGTSSKGEL